MLKTSTRFSPSIVRAAEELEAAAALLSISPNSKFAEYQETGWAMLDNAIKRTKGFLSPLGEDSFKLVSDCVNAMRAERVRSMALKRAALAAA